MVRRPSRQPAMQTNTATTSAAAESAQCSPNWTPASPTRTANDAHRSEEKCSASASKRLAATSSCADATARGRGRNRPRSKPGSRQTPRRWHHRRAIRARSGAWPPPRSRRRRAGTAARFRPAPRRLDLAVAVMVLLVGRLAGNAHGEISHHAWRRDRSANGRLPTGSPASRWQSPTNALAIVSPAEAAIEVSATCSFSCCMRRLCGLSLAV